MSYNTFGHLFRVTTWGESHGESIGCTIDGCPPNINFLLDDIQYFLNKRKPGSSQFVSQRNEPDTVKILSGVIEKNEQKLLVTTGTPITIIVNNIDHRPNDYQDISTKYRPGHADYSYKIKYGIRDHRGGGRSSARETVARVAAGAIARKIIPGISIRAALIQIGPHKINRNNWNWDEVDNNLFFSPDKKIIPIWEEYLGSIRKEKSSAGAIIEVVAENVPAGLGAPIYGKLDQDIAGLLMSINAVKGVEIGEGFQSVDMKGESNVDCMIINEKKYPSFLSNHSGGILGGISTGQPIIARFVVKPTSSIPITQNSVDENGNNVSIKTKGRHDPCVGIRAVPIGESMIACILADHYLRDRGQTGKKRYGIKDDT
ncbi:chorismate synthase [Candidatus Liberibacter americanus]|uniref:Chorismate synthase n=1 Tax=Candidatus Liberibacter americanus str. Sao Paulo TaxID=1261131 RepID=U6B3L1_9HYPH|nr:chorismate synthase [Candidatus Liberibacter americanus]AHA27659.1 Chorismate synthase [Candidatus Liberibacter americanus str. Sao Paulo]EMS36368.1 chorismate synthase [Candidatus Liberibacter americanus PW_SP]